MSKIRRASVAVPTAKTYVRSALSKIQLAGGTSHPHSSTPYWAHSLADWFVTLTNWPAFWIGYSHRESPRCFVVGWWLTGMIGMHVDIRRRFLKKQAREAAAGKKE